MVFECFLCSKPFYSRYKLDIHFVTHTGEKPFKCKVCGNRFAHKGSFDRHNRIHTGEKPFACSYCEKRFITKSQVKKHLAKHHPTMDVSGCHPEACTNARIKERQKNHGVSEKNEKIIYNGNNVCKRITDSDTWKKIQPNCKFCTEVFGSFPVKDFNEHGCYLP